ncbi:MAG TPA: YqiA/YcfP family alpha/beta fold hydrolase [Vicinamibacterales bacterium]
MSAPALLYLHGFASSPRSSKARFFVERARAAGLAADCPDLNEPDFGTLTVTRMIERVREAAAAMPAGPVALVGSSLGAFVALHAVDRPGWDPSRPVERLVFLAPALDLAPGLARDFGPERMAEWERTGWIDVFHYAEDRMRRLHWGFMEDARRYDSNAVMVRTPTLIWQGRQDTVVSAAEVEQWASTRPWTTLRLVDDGHQLLTVLEPMWEDVLAFITGRQG